MLGPSKSVSVVLGGANILLYLIGQIGTLGAHVHVGCGALLF
jgi:hypothetical protein